MWKACLVEWQRVSAQRERQTRGLSGTQDEWVMSTNTNTVTVLAASRKVRLLKSYQLSAHDGCVVWVRCRVSTPQTT